MADTWQARGTGSLSRISRPFKYWPLLLLLCEWLFITAYLSQTMLVSNSVVWYWLRYPPTVSELARETARLTHDTADKRSNGWRSKTRGGEGWRVEGGGLGAVNHGEGDAWWRHPSSCCRSASVTQLTAPGWLICAPPPGWDRALVVWGPRVITRIWLEQMIDSLGFVTAAAWIWSRAGLGWAGGCAPDSRLDN